jgi:hypothetical protein
MARRVAGMGVSRLLAIAAVIVFLIAAFGVDVGGDVNLVALGLALLAASFAL